MATIPQFYGGSGVPLHVDGDVAEPARCWRSHRARVRDWLATVPDPEWTGPTRCGEWDVTALVRHLASASQFLGYTLHQGAAGNPTTLLQGFHPHRTVKAAAATLGELTPTTAREALADMDAAVDTELARQTDTGWSSTAEAPPGHLPAPLVVSHFVFDSWVHEYDLMLPRGERPPLDPLEAQVVLRYVVGLASVLTGSATALDVRLTEPDLRIGVFVDDGVTHLSAVSTPPGACVLEGTLLDVIDRATGREAGPVSGDERGLVVLDGLAAVLAG